MIRKVSWFVFWACLFVSVVSLAGGWDVLRLETDQIFTTTDPAKAMGYTSNAAVINLYDSLVYPRPDGSVAPLLAESWEISPDGLSYTFKLREGVRFHDGSEVTAEDVRFSFERLMTLGQGYSFLWRDIVDPENVEVLGKYVVRFRLNHPFGPFLKTLPLFWIVNKDLLLDHIESGDYGEFGDYGQAWLNEHDAGSGPYMLKTRVMGSRISWVRFDDYFRGWEDDQIDEVVSTYITEDATVISLMRTGQLDMTCEWLAYETYQALERLPGIYVVAVPSATVARLMINTKIPPTDDIHIRRAMAYAFDYEEVRDYLRPGVLPAAGPVPPSFAGHNKDVFQPKRDLGKAIEELKKSKYYPDIPPIEYVYVKVAWEEKIALLFQANMAAIGLKVNLTPLNWGAIVDRVKRIDTTPNVTHVNVVCNYPDELDFLVSYHSRPDGEGTFWETSWLQDEEIDALIDKAKATVEEAERIELYKQLQQKIALLVPDIFAFVDVVRHAFRNHITGYTFVPAMGYDYDFYEYYRVKK